MVAMDISNGLAYCVIQTALVILDVTDPRSPARVGTINNPPQSITTDVSVVGDLAYLTIDGRIVIYNVSNPAAPQLVRTSDFLGANALAISGKTLLYKTIDSFGFGDLSNPTSPIFQAPQSMLDIGAVGVYGTRLFAAGSSLLSFEAGPGLPTQRGSHASSGSPVGSIDGVAYLTATRCFPVVDFSDPANPILTRVVNTKGGQLTVKANRLYSKGEFLEIFDRSDPKYPRLLGSVRPVSARAATYSDTRAYVLGNQSVEIFDVSDASAPRSISAFPFTGNAYWIASVGDFVILGTSVFDARDPNRVVRAAEIPYYGRIQGHGHLLFGQEGESDLRITDFSNPFSPIPIGVFHWQTWNGFEALSVGTDLSAISRAQGRVEVADVRRPSAPAFVGYAQSIRSSPPSVAGRKVFMETADGITLWEAILADLPPQPELRIFRDANHLVIRWPATITGAKLYSVGTFGDQWQLVTATPAQDGDSFTYTNRFPSAPSQFYTLQP